YSKLATWDGLPQLALELFATEMSSRRLGLGLINSGLPIKVSQKSLDQVDDSHLGLGILQIRLDGLKPQQTCQLFLNLLPRIEKSSHGLRNLFLEELRYHAINL